MLATVMYLAFVAFDRYALSYCNDVNKGNVTPIKKLLHQFLQAYSLYTEAT